MRNCFVSILDQTPCREAHTTIDIQERPTSRDTEMSEPTGIIAHHANSVWSYTILGQYSNQPISQISIFISIHRPESEQHGANSLGVFSTFLYNKRLSG